MRTLILLASALIFAAPASAQQAAPLVQLEMKETTTIPGQPLVLRVTVLVPTWMPKAPVFPSFELPDLMVRLPERASGPTSKDVDGESWSGVTRAYRLYPLLAGQFELPEQTITVTYADPDSSEPLTATVNTDAVRFDAQIPDGAGTLDPFIAATKLSIEQTFEGQKETPLAPGDAIVRTLTAKITGAPPIFLPPLTPDASDVGLATYTDEPALNESDDRGVIGGSRIERSTYVAQGGGTFEIQPVTLQWFNIETGSVETTEATGLSVSVDGPPAMPVENGLSSIDIRRLGFLALALLAVAGGCWRYSPQVQIWWSERRRRHRNSERYAYKQTLAAINDQDYPRTVAALRQWAERLPSEGTSEDARFNRALADLGRYRYGGESRRGGAMSWHELRRALISLRAKRLLARGTLSDLGALPPLNPKLGAARS